MNKKGFTLVELLAVMVILAIIVVLVTPNILKTLKNTRKNALVVYSRKMINLTKQYYQAERVAGKSTTVPDDEPFFYSVRSTEEGKTAGPVGFRGTLSSDQTQYSGCVKITGSIANPIYTIYIVDNINRLTVSGKNLSDLTTPDIVTDLESNQDNSDINVEGCSSD